MASGASQTTLQEAVDGLNVLCACHTGSTLTEDIRKIVSELKTSLLRHTSLSHAFNSCAGPQLLLQLLSQCACAGKDTVLLLGVLGNICALDESCRDTVMADHQMIVDILRRTEECDVLNTAARLVANLSLDPHNIPTLLADGAVSLLVLSLARGSNACKRSLLRALRILAGNSNCRDEITSVEGIQAVADCLVSADSHVIGAAMQTLVAVTINNDAVPSLHNNSYLQVVVRHCHHIETHIREAAIRLLLKTTKCSDGRVALSSAGGVETLVGLMESSSDTQGLLNDIVRSVCLCCREVTSRQRLRDCGGLGTLITMLQEETQLVIHGAIVSALVCYYFDETTLKRMVQAMGLLPALVYHLNKENPQIQVMAAERVPKPLITAALPMLGCSPLTSPEEGCTDSDEITAIDREISPLEIDFDCNHGNTTLMPPKPLQPIGMDSEPSPISLDDFPSIGPPPSKRPLLEVDPSTHVPPNILDSILSSSCSYSTVEQHPHTASLPNPSLHYQVVLLLSRVSHLRDCLPLLSQPSTLSLILKAFISSNPTNLHLCKILARVLMSPHCFQNVLQTLAPSSLLQCTVTGTGEGSLSGHCVELLGRLSKIGESPYGQGVLAHMLLRGEDDDKHASSLAVPLLCTKSVRVCKKLMLSYGGYQDLCSLATVDGSLQSMALDSLLELAAHLPHFTHHNPPPTQPPPTKHCRYMDSDLFPFDLTLVIIGGGTARIPVHRRIMSESSDVFRVMLEGPYREGQSNEVTLQGTSPSTFIALVHHLYGCSWQCPHCPPHGSHTPIQSYGTHELIEAIARVSSDPLPAAHCLSVMVCAGQYLLNQLSTLCQHAAVQYVLPSNVVEMFCLSRMHECYCLSESCLRVVMAMGELRRDVFRNLITSYVGNDVLNMFKMFLNISIA